MTRGVEQAEGREKSEKQSVTQAHHDSDLTSKENSAIAQKEQARINASSSTELPPLEITSPATEDKQYFEDNSPGCLGKKELEERLKHPEQYEPETYGMLQGLHRNYEKVKGLVDDGNCGISDDDLSAFASSFHDSESLEYGMKGKGQWSKKDAKLNEKNMDSLTEAELDRRMADPRRYQQEDKPALEAAKDMYSEIKNGTRDSQAGITWNDVSATYTVDQRALEQQASRTGIYAPDNANRNDSTDLAGIAERLNQREIAEGKQRNDKTPHSLTREELTKRLEHPENYSAEELKALQSMDQHFDALEEMNPDDGERGISSSDLSKFDNYAKELDERRQNGAWMQKHFVELDADKSGSLSSSELQAAKAHYPDDERAQAVSSYWRNKDASEAGKLAAYDMQTSQYEISQQDIHKWVAQKHQSQQGLGYFVDKVDRTMR